MLVRQRLDQPVDDGQAADAGVEDADAGLARGASADSPGARRAPARRAAACRRPAATPPASPCRDRAAPPAAPLRRSARTRRYMSTRSGWKSRHLPSALGTCSPARSGVPGKRLPHFRAEARREAQRAHADPGEPVGRHRGGERRHQIAVALFPAGVLDHGIEVDADLVAGRDDAPGRRRAAPGSTPSRARRTPPPPAAPATTTTTTRSFGIEREQTLDRVGLGLELEQRVPARGEERHELGAEAGQRIERQAVGELAGADAEVAIGVAIEHLRQLGERGLGIDVGRERQRCRRDTPAGSSSRNPSGNWRRGSSPDSCSTRGRASRRDNARGTSRDAAPAGAGAWRPRSRRRQRPAARGDRRRRVKGTSGSRARQRRAIGVSSAPRSTTIGVRREHAGYVPCGRRGRHARRRADRLTDLTKPHVPHVRERALVRRPSSPRARAPRTGGAPIPSSRGYRAPSGRSRAGAPRRRRQRPTALRDRGHAPARHEETFHLAGVGREAPDANAGDGLAARVARAGAPRRADVHRRQMLELVGEPPESTGRPATTPRTPRRGRERPHSRRPSRRPRSRSRGLRRRAAPRSRATPARDQTQRRTVTALPSGGVQTSAPASAAAEALVEPPRAQRSARGPRDRGRSRDASRRYQRAIAGDEARPDAPRSAARRARGGCRARCRQRGSSLAP